MQESTTRLGNGAAPDIELPQGVTAREYVAVLKRYRLVIAAIVVVTTLGVGAYSMIRPQLFVAEALLLPPDKNEGMSFGNLLQKGGAGFDLKGLSENSSAEIFVQILRSRTLADSVLSRLDLFTQFGLERSERQRAVTMLQNSLSAEADRQGMIQVSCGLLTSMLPGQQEQKQVAETSARVVNIAIEYLDKLNRLKLVTRARRTREYLGRVKELKLQHLDSLQRAFQSFQTHNKAIALDKQIEASFTVQSQLEVEIQKRELELNLAMNDMTADTKKVEGLQSSLKELKSRKSRLESGQMGGALSLAMSRMPELARQYASLKLELEIATQIYTYLEVQYVHEQGEEARDLPTVSVLDPAEAPMQRTSPRRLVMTVVAFFGSLTAALVGVFVVDRFRRSTPPGNS